jgi:hypothetical protein
MWFVIFKFASFRILQSGIRATAFNFISIFSVSMKCGLLPGLQIFVPTSVSTNTTYIICSQLIYDSLQICFHVIFASSFHYTSILRHLFQQKQAQEEGYRHWYVGNVVQA